MIQHSAKVFFHLLARRTMLWIKQAKDPSCNA
jgi:hypothetical protein